MSDIIFLDRINKFYGSEVVFQVLFDINLSIKSGQFTAIIGPSGSGKSTLLNIIGLLETPTSGKVFLDGLDTSRLNKDELAACRNEKTGFIFQFHYLLPEFTALENILIPYWIGKGRPPGKVVDRALHLMKRIGIEQLGGKYPNQLSGGQQQRVAIARSLINNPKIIFADEPTGNLDSKTSNMVMELLKEIVSENNTTLVMVTHDRDIAAGADRTIEIVDGRINFDSAHTY
ncbi:MAG TPA: ABC transporter ATP-binding protein [Bacillota bacterium]|mgnify:CR=1 FL=1|jgi:lipoprotein-releasing system ATP-binding protein|nr:ABC transporter ATP-binding protein [Peptococcaceae bacterium MAG4]NLW37013.1 ABC transporter ATP-binding protein [Peptococcaceae bacterium]HPZ43415.1 ABC transporter ATP-binding protein [Bacillota bacterium]HQD75919.1 ABC transporter ATP-binding protein [Bacillota bacterium]HUM58699.1 ABC transporter ATP-binding protein [Bacillota bacterium]